MANQKQQRVHILSTVNAANVSKEEAKDGNRASSPEEAEPMGPEVLV